MPKKYTIEYIREQFEKESYTLLSVEYIGSHTKLDFTCPKGHKHSIVWQNWQQGCRCGLCVHDSQKLSLEQVKSSFESEGYTLLNIEYINSHTKLDFICPNGHRHSTTWNNWQQGRKCGLCARPGVRKLNIPLYETYAHKIEYANKVRPFYDEEGRKLLEAECMYCGKWFVPTAEEVKSRIKVLEGKRTGEGNLYCSQKCKKLCPVYGVNPNYYLSPKLEELSYTNSDLHVWSQEVLAIAEHKCEICGEPAEHAHHIIPKKLEPFLATDPENGLAVCIKCHYEHCHTGECSTGSIANKVCTLTSK